MTCRPLSPPPFGKRAPVFEPRRDGAFVFALAIAIAGAAMAGALAASLPWSALRSAITGGAA